MKVLYPAEIMFALGIILFSISLFFAGLILKRLLKIIKKPSIWVLEIFGSLLVLAGAILHIIKLTVYFPALARSNPYDLLPQIAKTMQVGSLEGLMILLAGFFAILSSLIYYIWSTR
ncbi:MAG: hypothetical protein QME48_04320 [bacterium]|uniref:Uncharacterized protein n=2 Tax=Bacteria candidate phyla TaxID=1783234 RepID=A0A101I2K5_UNCT6|nr:MAG: hypothetical protein XD76_1022 [candidate division TA06 bacterium 32_111]KUK87304.1 MAG: hypothetical protein XE03_0912 [candidate division TA06 bacterium 34_109]MDI6700438.1 hypothetical protein [bacterium]HAF07562.1 hypothetical protein [candidate division WOR-3 bacterium]HCP16811.1 hypothetical protein [candidate division WOR-3 bacterium]